MVAVKTYSPHDQLPAKDPKYAEYPIGHFYYNTAKHLIKDTVRIMDNGVAIDLDKVIELEFILDEKINDISKNLSENSIVDLYLKTRHNSDIEEYKANRKSKMRKASYYKVPFNHTKMEHRSYFMDEFAKAMKWSLPNEKLATGVSKWTVRLTRKYAKENLTVKRLLDGTINLRNIHITAAMNKLAQDKADLYNEKYLKQMKLLDIEYPEFNPSSSKQKRELFGYWGIESEEISKKTNLQTWDREQINICLKQVKNMITLKEG